MWLPIPGANNLTLNINGLVIGKEYLFQGYWEGWPTEQLDFTAEGTTINVADQNATLITFRFTATDDTLNISLNKTVAVDGNEWLSGYSLQEVPDSAPDFTTTLLDEEADIINTGGTLISAANFGEAAVTINGILHGAGCSCGGHHRWRQRQRAHHRLQRIRNGPHDSHRTEKLRGGNSGFLIVVCMACGNLTWWHLILSFL